MAELQELLPLTQKLSFLYIEADKELRTSITTPLKKIFALVDGAADGYEGLNRFKINHYDIVLMDADVPNMAGTLLIKNIRTINPNQFIIYTSAKELSVTELLDLIKHGINGCLFKPFTINDLLNQLHTGVSALYKQKQLAESLERMKTLKEQQEKMLEIANEREQKIKDELLYERKRLGRLMKTQKDLEKDIETYQDQLGTMRNINELTGAASKHALQEAMKQGGEKALLYLNIDHFERINTLYGMGQGNKVLQESVKRLERFLPENATLYHITADEFVILLIEPMPSQELALADQILAFFREATIDVDSNSFTVSFSIGVDRGEGMQLFAQAKTASKEAKVHGGGRIRQYKPDSDYITFQRRHRHWIKIIQDAIENDRVLAYYQPIINNRDSSTVFYEVLCRIEDETGEVINAEQFIQAAELAGLSTKISRIVIDKAFKYFSSGSHHFSININKHDLEEEYLEAFLLYKCERYNVEPKRVYLELIEDSSVSSSKVMVAQIEKIRSAGFNIVVDDFGTEHFMLSKMLQVEAQYIKIDSTFIHDLPNNKFHRMVVENIVEFAKKAGMKTVAEHVDSEELHQLVHDLGVDYSQGFYIGKPDLRSN